MKLQKFCSSHFLYQVQIGRCNGNTGVGLLNGKACNGSIFNITLTMERSTCYYLQKRGFATSVGPGNRIRLVGLKLEGTGTEYPFPVEAVACILQTNFHRLLLC